MSLGSSTKTTTKLTVARLTMTKFTKSILLGILSLSLPVSSSVEAQDILPRDNGIMTYHQAPRWRESEAHPLRVLAYALHPIGWVAREAIFRPLSSFAASTEVTRSVMGYREPFDYRNGICFSTSDEAPDCRAILPYTGIMKDFDGKDGGNQFGMASDRQIFFPDVNFDFDKDSLNDLGRGRVKQIAQLLENVPNMDVVIEGHTDYKGSDEYNMKLGERRASAVLSELVRLGIPESRLSPISYGEGRPVFTEEEDWARAVNRRAQFTVRGEGEVVAASYGEAELPPANQ